jgi:hypothetical protein
MAARQCVCRLQRSMTPPSGGDSVIHGIQHGPREPSRVVVLDEGVRVRSVRHAATISITTSMSTSIFENHNDHPIAQAAKQWRWLCVCPLIATTTTATPR